MVPLVQVGTFKGDVIKRYKGGQAIPVRLVIFLTLGVRHAPFY